jgi:hypothetical protein
MVKRVYKWEPMLTRPLGRPKNGWEDDKWYEETENKELAKNEVVAPKEELNESTCRILQLLFIRPHDILFRRTLREISAIGADG